MVRDESWKQLRLGVGGGQVLRRRPAAVPTSTATSSAPSPTNRPTCCRPATTGSQAVAIAKDLLHLADIKILHGQDPAVADDLDRLLGLGPIAQHLVTGWAMQGKGRALWCVGDQLYKVQTVLHPRRAAPHLHQRRPPAAAA